MNKNSPKNISLNPNDKIKLYFWIKRYDFLEKDHHIESENSNISLNYHIMYCFFFNLVKIIIVSHINPIN